MDTIYSTVLVTAPVAFMVGWLLAKVLFRHMSIVRPAAAPRAAAAPSAVAEPAPARESDTRQLRDALRKRTAEAESLRTELDLLRAGVAEGEQRVAELKQRLAAQAQPPEQSRAATGDTNTEFHKLLKVQQSRVVERDERIAELEVDLEGATQRIKRLADIFRRWRGRARPLARQYRQQRIIIKELREELRQRDIADQAAPNAALRPPAAPVAVPQIANSHLQSLHGVGPALQERLKGLGIYNLSQFADMAHADLAQLHAELGLGQRRDAKYDWISQARVNLGLPPRSIAARAPEPASRDQA